MRLLQTVFFSLALCVLQAQVIDNFSDGNFTVNPTWTGDDTLFLVNGNFELQSNGEAVSSTIYLAVPNTLMDSVEWNFLVRLGFNPSSTNYVRIYLASDQQNLKGSLNGYFVQLGEAGTAPDSIDIFRQTGTTLTKVFTGVSGCMNSSNINSVRLKITRSSAGEWNVFADCSGGNNLNFEGGFTDNTHTATNHFGFYCRYSTPSRSDQYFFDDVMVRHILPDTVKPVVNNIAVVSASEIDIKFSEAVDLVSAQNMTNYIVNNGIGNPAVVAVDANDNALVHLNFSTAFPNGQINNISIENVKDFSGNTMLPVSFPFVFYQPEKGDIVINEILADPDPQVNLPNDEYVELKNNKNFPVTLTNWKFADAVSTITLPAFTIPADSFVVICKNTLIDSFVARGFNDILIVGLNSLPSLNNNSDDLTLYDNNDNIIDFVSYTLSWYDDPSKRNGGWSLERIDPTTSCGEGQNWRASLDVNGGTPGKQNSVFGTFNDNVPPAAISFEIILPDTVRIVFSENIDSLNAVDLNNYALNNGIGNPSEIIFSAKEVWLIFSTNIDSTINYTLTIQNMRDCSGNVNTIQNLSIEVPVAANQFDILITEIYADPEPSYGLPNAEYVELYNNTSKTISLNGWTFSDNTSTVTLPNKSLLPQSYLILCSVNHIQEYSLFGDVLGVSSFPSLNNSGETLTIKDETENIIHTVTYSDRWYGDNLKKAGGFSLEMIDLNSPCSGADNWKASEANIGGTPGKENSVNGINPDSDAPETEYVLVVNDTQLTLIFNEPLLQNSINNTSQFAIQPADVSVVSFTNNINPSEINITLSAPLRPKTIYTITVSGISDCSGNLIQAENSVSFGIAEHPDSGDVMINEVLFNPESFGSDFVELYNRSDKIIALNSLLILRADFNKRDSVISFTRAADRGYLLLPENFVALTSDVNYIRERYFSPNPKNIIAVPALPNYPDREGVVIVMDTQLNKLDELAYQEKWHFALLDDKNGVSLERINYHRPTQDENNWQSAASTVGFATPAYKNSQFSDNKNAGNTFWLNPEAFSPDNDGYNDVLNLHYQFKEAGWLANINIYDSSGRLIRELAKNELLETEGTLTWNGITDEGKKARIGIHIVWAEFFKPDGEVKRFKKSCVVVGRID